MEYRNSKTGTVIDVKSEMGGDWKPVAAPVPAKKKAEPKKKGTVKK